MDKDKLVEHLTVILSGRELPGTRDGLIAEPRALAGHIAAHLRSVAAALRSHAQPKL